MKTVDYVVMYSHGGAQTVGGWRSFEGRGSLGLAREIAEAHHGRLYRRVREFDMRVGLDKATERLTLVEVFP